ncbi:MAG: competence protein ComEC, competence protein ComEC [Candidatus Parcubacteria bacterium]
MNKAYFVSIINIYFHEPYSSLVNGMIFGVQLTSNRDFQTELRNVGLIHIVVLSGMNISIVATFISSITSRFSKLSSSLITILIITLYAYFVGLEAPIVRSLIMGVFTHVSFIYGKRATALYLLFVAGLCSILIWPEWIKSLSFYLSYGATLGLLLFCRHSQPSSDVSRLKLLKYYFIDELYTSLAAQVFTIPIIFYYFRQISLISPLANIMVAWSILPISIFGMLAAFLGGIDYYIGLPFAVITYGFAAYIVIVVHLLSSLPFSAVNF